MTETSIMYNNMQSCKLYFYAFIKKNRFILVFNDKDFSTCAYLIHRQSKGDIIYFHLI